MPEQLLRHQITPAEIPVSSHTLNQFSSENNSAESQQVVADPCSHIYL